MNKDLYKKDRFRVAMILLITFLGIVSGWFYLCWQKERDASVYKVFESPYGQARVVSYAVEPVFGKLFVGESDYPGIARLEDCLGNRYAEVKMPLVQVLSGVTWYEDRVMVYVFADWEIPEKIREEVDE